MTHSRSIFLRDALLCLDCEAIRSAACSACPVCASTAAMTLADKLGLLKLGREAGLPHTALPIASCPPRPTISPDALLAGPNQIAAELEEAGFAVPRWTFADPELAMATTPVCAVAESCAACPSRVYCGSAHGCAAEAAEVMA